jgi:hypothetical protein
LARKRSPDPKTPEPTGATVGYEARLWQMADAAIVANLKELGFGDVFERQLQSPVRAIVSPPFIMEGPRGHDERSEQHGDPGRTTPWVGSTARF